jgi:hypothetical protein
MIKRVLNEIMQKCWEDVKKEKAMREIRIGRENGEQVMLIIKEKLVEENAEWKVKMILTGAEECYDEENKKQEEDALISYIFNMHIRKA